MRYPGPHLARRNDLALRLDTTKQALNEFEDWGYSRRALDPDDRRRRLID